MVLQVPVVDVVGAERGRAALQPTEQQPQQRRSGDVAAQVAESTGDGTPGVSPALLVIPSRLSPLAAPERRDAGAPGHETSEAAGGDQASLQCLGRVSAAR